ncbi:hypothetical protein OG874_00365 [Nocardia sp. NBC_00565]|uniref:hypothetical protein n=1 Tax=Nocardia sp. NBC_00565 TaxID=2975993 RepID=UPI002E824671|nr:hypothetical protein [Nocardia sp. NBC_00565]WUC03708.1 hypothetical protein OG874_00365 [Nocardia sp. NBC_00565]
MSVDDQISRLLDETMEIARAAIERQKTTRWVDLVAQGDRDASNAYTLASLPISGRR